MPTRGKLAEAAERIAELYTKGAAKRISKYAETSLSEFFAEAFSYYTHPSYGTAAMPRLSKELDEALRLMLGA